MITTDFSSQAFGSVSVARWHIGEVTSLSSRTEKLQASLASCTPLWARSGDQRGIFMSTSLSTESLVSGVQRT